MGGADLDLGQARQSHGLEFARAA
eukprot:COSAG04_NODE_20616_length_390_cov_0.690722_1_plen_23_part_10